MVNIRTGTLGCFSCSGAASAAIFQRDKLFKSQWIGKGAQAVPALCAHTHERAPGWDFREEGGTELFISSAAEHSQSSQKPPGPGSPDLAGWALTGKEMPISRDEA